MEFIRALLLLFLALVVCWLFVVLLIWTGVTTYEKYGLLESAGVGVIWFFGVAALIVFFTREERKEQ